MTKLAPLAVIVAALALSACGSSESAKEEAQAGNVEMPAEEAVSDVDATPVADSAAQPGGDATTAAAAPAAKR
ncbi:MAG: hypothetical protein RLZZ84_84 [Pseudomonadota bacterium]|jgi:hypothetical protein